MAIAIIMASAFQSSTAAVQRANRQRAIKPPTANRQPPSERNSSQRNPKKHFLPAQRRNTSAVLHWTDH
jgi:hypothetical protein